MASIVILSVLAPSVALAESGVQNPSQLTDGVFEVSNDGQIEGWERSAYTLRTDDTDASTQIPQAQTVNGEELGDGSFTTSTDESDSNDGINTKSLVRDFGNERNPIGVHNAGEDIQIVFDDDLANAGSQLNSQDNVELVAARVDPEDGSGVPSTTSDARDLLSDVDDANRNASFEILINDDGSLNSTGELSTTEQFSEGHYVLFAAVKEGSANGFETDSDKNISVDGDVVLIGMEQITVQETSSIVTAPTNPDPGENITFEVDSSDAFSASGSVTHAVAIYNKSTFESARFDVVVDSDALGTDFSFDENSQLEHSINEVNGIARVEDGTTLNQNDLSDGNVSRPVTAGNIVDFLADEAGTEDLDTDPITNGGSNNAKYERINASVTAVNGEDPSTDVNVKTFENFSEGTYQFVVVSTLDSNESQMSTATGTISLSVSQKSATVSNNQANVRFSKNERVRSADISDLPGTVTSVDVSNNDDTNPSSDDVPVDNVGTFLDITPDSSVEDQSVTISVTVQDSTVAGIEDPTLYHDPGNGYQELDTDVEDTADGTKLTAETNDGLSPFAVAESTDDGGGGGGSGGGSSLDSVSSQFVVSELFPETVEVTQGNNIGISATVRADTTEQQTQDVELRIDGDTVATKTVTLDGGESTTVQFTGVSTSELEPGEYEHGIFTADDSQTGTLTITAPDGATPTSTPETGTDEQTEADEPATEPDDDAEVTDEPATEEQETTAAGGPGFTVVVALIAIIAVALLTRRQRSE